MGITSRAVQVFFHLTVRRENERVLETTRLSEDGVEGSGVPKAFMLGKGQRMPRGWELALYGGPLHPTCLPNCTAVRTSVHVPSDASRMHYTHTPAVWSLCASSLLLLMHTGAECPGQILNVEAHTDSSFVSEIMACLRGSVDTADMRKGEKARLMMRPEYGYAMKDCKVIKWLRFAAGV